MAWRANATPRALEPPPLGLDHPRKCVGSSPWPSGPRAQPGSSCPGPPGGQAALLRWQGDTFFFPRSYKALAAHPGFRPRLSREALALFLRHGYLPAPYCIYEGVFKLPAGSILTVEGPRPGDRAVSHSFWSLEEVARRGLENPFAGPPEEAVERLEALLLDAVRLRLVADVPLGAFLSGGIDSSLVVALMQSLCPRPVKTFTIGFREEHFDEASHAKRVADSLGTDHTALYLTGTRPAGSSPSCPGSSTSPSPTPARSPPTWSPAWPGGK